MFFFWIFESFECSTFQKKKCSTFFYICMEKWWWKMQVIFLGIFDWKYSRFQNIVFKNAWKKSVNVLRPNIDPWSKYILLDFINNVHTFVTKESSFQIIAQSPSSNEWFIYEHKCRLASCWIQRIYLRFRLLFAGDLPLFLQIRMSQFQLFLGPLCKFLFFYKQNSCVFFFFLRIH